MEWGFGGGLALGGNWSVFPYFVDKTSLSSNRVSNTMEAWNSGTPPDTAMDAALDALNEALTDLDHNRRIRRP